MAGISSTLVGPIRMCPARLEDSDRATLTMRMRTIPDVVSMRELGPRQGWQEIRRPSRSATCCGVPSLGIDFATSQSGDALFTADVPTPEIGVRLSGCHLPYVSERQSHSAGPK